MKAPVPRYALRAAALLLCLAASLLAVPALAENLRFAFSRGKPVPYVVDEYRGIEVEIVRSALRTQGIGVTSVFMSYNRMARMGTMEIIDGRGVTKPREGDGLFYSDPYIYYQDVALTRADAGIRLREVSDLACRMVGGWQTAIRDIGGRFAELFGEGGPCYGQFFPVIKDAGRVEMLWGGRLEVVITDLLIFDYFTRRLARETGRKLAYDTHWLWERKHWFYAAFRTERHRDLFNAGIRKIMADGTFDAIYRQYAKYEDPE